MFDLHFHSIFSDGALTPEELAAAARAGLTAAALTDHDTTAGVPRFLAAAAGLGLRALSGLEISVDRHPGVLHMLGYGCDVRHPGLQQGLERLRRGRETRNAEILRKLAALGAPVTEAQVRAQAGGEVVGRPHFALALVAAGHVADKNEAFTKFLARGQPAYCERDRLTVEESIRLIHAAGGLAVLAHPFTLKLGRENLRRTIGTLKETGLDGIEAYYPEHDGPSRDEYIGLARAFDLLVTSGTDYHGPALTPDIRLGAGFGSLRAPDELVEKLLARLATRQSLQVDRPE